MCVICVTWTQEQIALLYRDCEENIVSLNTNAPSYWGLRVELLGLNEKEREQDHLEEGSACAIPKGKEPRHL